MLSVNNIEVIYDHVILVLKGTSLEVPKGNIVALLGANGAGKTTLIRSISGVLRNASESVLFEGTAIGTKESDAVMRDGIAMVPEGRKLFPSLSVKENLLIGTYGRKVKGYWTLEAIYDLFPILLEKADAPATSLSGGQQQRLCIARAIAIKPDVILMDEPCSALDPIATEKIEDLINELKENYAIVMVTHSMSQAARVSQRAAYFHLGNLIEVNDTQKIFNNPEHELTKNYISGRTG